MRITGLTIIDKPRPWANGDRGIAFFNVEYAGISLKDCLLIRGNSGVLMVQPPRGETRNGDRAIGISDPEIRRAMAATALKAYEAIGGAV